VVGAGGKLVKNDTRLTVPSRLRKGAANWEGSERGHTLVTPRRRIGFGFRSFENYRIRALLYAGWPNWRVLGSIVVR
jgi:hypothetical protein